MNSFLLYLLAREIASTIAGGRIAAVRRLDPLLVVELSDPPKPPLYLVVFLATPGPFLWLDGADPLPGLGEGIMRRLEGSRILDSVEAPRDRILRLPVESSEGGDRELALYLYGSAAKVRIQAGKTVVESLHSEEAGTPVPHTFGKKVPFLGDAGAGAIDEALGAATDPSRAVLGLESEQVAAFVRSKKADTAGLLAFRDALAAGNTDFVLATPNRLGAVAPYPATPLPGGITAVTKAGRSVRNACAEVGAALVAVARDVILSRESGPLRRRLQARSRLLEKLRGQATAAAKFEIDRAEADILAAYQSKVPPGAREVELPDLYEDGKTRRIELDPSLSVREQVQRRYKRAGKLERSRAVLAQRIGDVETEVREVETVIDAIAGTTDLGESLRTIERASRRFGLRRQKRSAPRATVEKQYRRFDLGSGWFVLVGRSDKENDEITFRIARPDDIWMHAQQTPGSHIVLKCLGKPGNPPDAILEQAAAIAAHYSKAKHSKLVPVIYTRRKYVRKFRGAKLGEVICEREKTIFAEPRLPE